MENVEIKLCRICNKEGLVFCDIYHEAIKKIITLIPNLIEINDKNLEHITKICTTCFQTVKSINYNIENIIDIQKILRIENAIKPKDSTSSLSSKIHIEDIKRKYTNINVKRVSINSAEKNASFDDVPAEKLNSNNKIVIEALPHEHLAPKIVDESPTKKTRCLMCISCSKKFTDLDKMQFHLRSCKPSSNGSNLKCFCGQVINTQKNFELHVYTQHRENKRKHICIICQKVFTSLFNLQNHMHVHEITNEKFKGKKEIKIEVKTNEM